MPSLVPGQFRALLKQKIEQAEEEETLPPLQIKKQAGSFSPRASDYHRVTPSSQSSSSTRSLPTGSPLKQSVHERMKAYVKEQYGKK